MELKLERLNLLNRPYARDSLLAALSLLLISLSLVPPAGYALSLPAPAGFNPAVQVPLQNANTTTTNSGIAPEQSQPQPPPTFANRSAWQGYMSHNPAPQPGCFVATYANPVWQSAQCVTAPSEPFMPSHAQAMLSTWSGGGSGSDWVAQAPGDVISTSTGSFQSVTTTGETCTCSGGANDYSLQINSNAFPTNTIYTQPPGGSSFGATGWEQFIYSTQKGILIQYWVLGYYTEHSTCPDTGPPNGNSWQQSGGNCYADSPAQPVPAVPATSLSSLTLTGNAFNPNLAVSKNDQVTLCGVSNPSGGSCYAVAITAKVLDLYENWQDSEFNVFGDASDSLAIFNSPTTITVVQTLLDQNLKGIVPSCVNKEPETNGFNGFTGESNNLNLGSCAVSGNSIGFRESNALETLTTGVDSGSGTVSPNFCVPDSSPGCSELFGESVTVTAKPSSGWGFADWSTQTGISCSKNPCTFTMPLNAVTLKATFGQVETLTTGVDSGSGSVIVQTTTTASCSKGCMEVAGSSLTVIGSPSSGWVFADWSTQTGISCSNNPCTFTMPLNAVTLKATFVKPETIAVSYMILGGGQPPVDQGPVFNYVALGVSKSLDLTTQPVNVAADFGSSWSVTPNFGEIECGGSTCTATGQAWVDTGATSGKITVCCVSLVFTYQHQYYLTMQVNPSGTGSTTPSTSGWYNAGQKVTIGATAKTVTFNGLQIQEYNFLNWTGSGAGSYSGRCAVAGCSSAAAVTMNAPITETAYFGVIITVTSTPTGAGYVTVDGAAVTTPWTTTWVIGSMHTIAAVSPVSCGTGCRYNFTTWSDGGAQSHTITVPGILTTYTATFQQTYLLTTAVNPSGAGYVLIFSPPSSTGWYNAGVTVTLTAVANAGDKFLSWTGSGTGSYTGTGSDNSATIIMNGPITETANFEQTSS